MGPIRDIKNNLISVHKKVERFLDDAINKATLSRALAIILITGFPIGLLVVLDHVYRAPDSTLQNDLLIFFQYFFLSITAFLFLALYPAVCAWVVRKINGKTTKMKQPNLVQIVYSNFHLYIALVFLFLLITFFSLVPAPLFAILWLLSEIIVPVALILYIYISIALFLRLYRTSLIEYIEYLIASFLLAFALVPLIWMLVEIIVLIYIALRGFL